MEALGVLGIASGWVLVGSCCELGDGCRGINGQYRRGGGTWHSAL